MAGIDLIDAWYHHTNLNSEASLPGNSFVGVRPSWCKRIRHSVEQFTYLSADLLNSVNIRPIVGGAALKSTAEPIAAFFENEGTLVDTIIIDLGC